MLSIRGLNQYYGESHILRNVDLDALPQQCTCVMGRNGVGKTTLMKALVGLLPVRSGAVTLNEADLSRASPEVRALSGIGYVPQGRDVFGQLTVEENLRVAMSAKGQFSGKLPDRVLDLFPVLREMLHRRGGDLSGGQQQQLSIARALVLEPKLLVLDEPTEGIQPNIVKQIGEVLRQLVSDDGITVLLVEQKLPFARRNADTFYIMNKGELVTNGPMADLSDDLAHQYLSV
ncbi:MAG: urea ABC transporter ATP-binding subunit UrtE [Pseudomonadota bacterium]